MKISLESAAGRNLFTAYGEGFVEVNGERQAVNVLVSAETVTAGWFTGDLDALESGHLEPVARMRPEIVLLGSGERFRFPAPACLVPLHAAGIGVEVMDTRAACRTYNILLAEGRRVVAALIVQKGASGS